MSDENAKMPIDWRERLTEVFVECLRDGDFGQSGDDATDIIYHIKNLRRERNEAIERATEAEAWNVTRDSAAAKELNRIMRVLFRRVVSPDERMSLVQSLRVRMDWLNKTLNRLDMAAVWTGADDLLDDRVASLIAERDHFKKVATKLESVAFALFMLVLIGGKGDGE